MTYNNANDRFLHVGQIVWWHPAGDPGQEPWAAVVTQINQRTLRVGCFSKVNKDLIVRDGVRHISDPFPDNEETRRQGAWSHTPQTNMLMELFGDPKVQKKIA